MSGTGDPFAVYCTTPARSSGRAIFAGASAVGPDQRGRGMVMARRDYPESGPDEESRAERADAMPAFAAPATEPLVRRGAAFGPDRWALGLAAALPALIVALALLGAAGMLPLIPRLPTGLVLGALLVPLGAAALAALLGDYPAWTHPGLVLIPTLLIFIPAAILRGQLVARINGDTDRMVAVPLAICWLLLLAATIVIVLAAVALGRRAPSFSGLAILPLPLIFSWLLILAPPFGERAVTGALGTALALAALATFTAWIAPPTARPIVPLVAVAAQFGLFWLQRLGWPTFKGVVRPLIALDVVLFIGLLGALALAPYLAAWVRRAAWPALEQRFG